MGTPKNSLYFRLESDEPNLSLSPSPIFADDILPTIIVGVENGFESKPNIVSST